jgi:tetratricopeptide (TPR) repeat protein/tRNA A-37 threonylcarbamoyl transferase component Bud32
MKADLSGQAVGSCVLRERLASGGFGTVYRATDRHLGVERAVKVIHPFVMEQKGFRERFLAELRVSAALDHPNIVRVLYAVEEASICGYVMEFIPGQTLRKRLREGGRLEVAQALDAAAQIARAVAHAQSRRPPIIHRDLTPENVVVRPDGVVKVMDYGIAATIDDPSLAVAKAIVGKPKYMPPEQFEGEVTASADLYALGVILYEMLAGTTPFAGDAPMQIYRAHVTQAPRPPSELAPHVGRELDALVLRALAKDPSERFPDAGSFLRALEYVQSDVAGRPRAAGVDLLALLRPPAALAAARVPTPEEAARVETLFNEGFSLLSNQRYADAAERFDAALKLDPAHFDSRRHRRIARLRQLEIREDEQDRERKTRFEDEAMRFGMSLFSERRWDEAAEAFDRVLALNPDRPDARRYRYEARERAASEGERLREARARAEAALARGEAAEAAGRREEAAAAFAEALEAAPGLDSARRRLDGLGAGRAEAAKEAAGRAAEAEARAAGAQGRARATELARAGLARFAAGDFGAAAAALDEAVRADPQLAVAARFLEKSRRALADAAEARSEEARMAEAADARADESSVPEPDPCGEEKAGVLVPALADESPPSPVPGPPPPSPAPVPPAPPPAPVPPPPLPALPAAPITRAWAPPPSTPAPAAVAATPPGTDAEDAPFVGRTHTLQAMEKVLDDTPRGRGAVLLVRGDPGHGKSRLLREFATRNSFRNFLFISAACRGNLGDYFAPWKGIALEALRAVETLDLVAYTKLAMKFAPELGRFGEPFRKIALAHDRNFDLTVGDERIRELVVELLSAVLERQPLFVMIDALELADSETLAVLDRVALLTRDRPLVLAGTVSQTRAADTNPWARYYPSLKNQKLVREFLVPRLPDEDLRRWLGAILARELGAAGGDPPRAEARIASEIARVSGGDLHQAARLARHLAASGLVVQEAGLLRLTKKGPLTDDDLVAGLGEALFAKYRGLNRPAAGVMRWLSLAPEGFPFEALQDVTGVASGDLYHATGELVAQKLAAESAEKGRKQYWIPSPPLREKILGEIAIAERQGMFDRGAAALERLERVQPGRAAAMALRGTNADRAVETCLRAAEAELEACRAGAAREWLEKSAEWLPRSRQRGHPAAHAEALGRALLGCGQPDAALRSLQQAAAAAPPERLAAIRLDAARCHLALGRRREAADALAVARERAKDAREQAGVALVAARLALAGDDLDGAGGRLEEARRGAEPAGLAGPVLSALAEWRFVRGEVRQAEAHASEALERGGAPEAVLVVARCRMLHGKALIAAARLESALEGCDDRVFEAEARALLAVARSFAARGAAAREQAGVAVELAAAAGAPFAHARARLAAADAALAAEDAGAARLHAAKAQELFDAVSSRSGLARAALSLAEAHLAGGDSVRASSYLDLAVPGAISPELAGRHAVARAELILRLGRLNDSRAAFHDALKLLGDRWPDPVLVGRVYTGLAAVHTAGGNRDGALRNCARAFKTLRDTELALPFALARAQWAAILARGPAIAASEAREAAQVAAEAAEALRQAGAAVAEARAREAAERLAKLST